MPVRKHKPVEANDGSYGGKVLAAFDQQETERSEGCGIAATCDDSEGIPLCDECLATLVKEMQHDES
jgi:hypothetical protein